MRTQIEQYYFNRLRIEQLKAKADKVSYVPHRHIPGCMVPTQTRRWHRLAAVILFVRAAQRRLADWEYLTDVTYHPETGLVGHITSEGGGCSVLGDTKLSQRFERWL